MFKLTRILRPRRKQLAALDLGSNSFHLIIADWVDGELKVRDKVKEMVRLGWGLQANGRLDSAASSRAMACLERFGERLREFEPGSVRVVGTKTLRSVHNASAFLQEAERRLGHPIEIISGEEEARLIYLGVAHYAAPIKGRRMVIDIGGGSTELAIGLGMELQLKESLDMGCVAVTKQFFQSGIVNNEQIDAAVTFCSQQLLPVANDFIDLNWQECLGSSGTIRAVAEVCLANKLSDGSIGIAQLERLIEMYREAGLSDLAIDGLSKERQPVFLGGILTLYAIFKSLCIEQMQAAEWALREGLLYELKGRFEQVDIRPSSVHRLAERYHVDRQFSNKVTATCHHLLAQVADPWMLDKTETAQLLEWASSLFLVGLDITHNEYHKHGAYVVKHVDLAGFSRQAQAQLAAMVLAHRKSFPVKQFPMHDEGLVKAALLLRLAVIFNRAKRKQLAPELQLRASGQQLSLVIEEKWLQDNPLTHADLQNEQAYLRQIDYSLELIVV